MTEIKPWYERVEGPPNIYATASALERENAELRARVTALEKQQQMPDIPDDLDMAKAVVRASGYSLVSRRFIITFGEFIHDFKKGDFDLPKLAELDLKACFEAWQEGVNQAEVNFVEQGEPVAWQYRMRPDWEDRWQGWVDCSKEAYRNMARVPLLHDWHYEVRALFTHPVRPMSDEEREDAFSRLPNAKSGQFYYYLGIADAEAFHGIKGATE
jgi:hypothetical protein